VLKFATETRFYRHNLRNSYEFGSHLRKVEALSADAMLDDERPLFLLSPESSERHREEIARYRARLREAKENVKCSRYENQKRPVRPFHYRSHLRCLGIR
jgi:hypothetical protein